MTRKLLCRSCGEKWDLHPDDRRDGWSMRKVYVSLGAPPPGHGMSLNGKFSPMSELCCDSCSEVLNNSIAVAVTMWRGSHEPPQPRCWEEEYGTVMLPEAVKVHDTLTNKPKTK